MLVSKEQVKLWQKSCDEVEIELFENALRFHNWVAGKLGDEAAEPR